MTSVNKTDEEIQESLKKGRKRRKIRRAIFITSMLIVPVIQFLIFYVYINLDSFPLAFQSKNVYFNKIEWVGWQNFTKVFREIKNNGETGTLGGNVKKSV